MSGYIVREREREEKRVHELRWEEGILPCQYTVPRSLFVRGHPARNVGLADR